MQIWFSSWTMCQQLLESVKQIFQFSKDPFQRATVVSNIAQRQTVTNGNVMILFPGEGVCVNSIYVYRNGKRQFTSCKSRLRYKGRAEGQMRMVNCTFHCEGSTSCNNNHTSDDLQNDTTISLSVSLRALTLVRAG